MSKFTSLQIAVTETVYNNATFREKLESAWTWLTGSSDYTNLWAGWNSNYRVVASPSITVYVYRNSLKNIKGDLLRTMTPTAISNLIAKVKEHPQVEASVNKTPDASLAAWGVEAKPSAGP